jgi:ferredoxin
MRVRVDHSRCRGHTQCEFTAPMLFRLRDEDGHSDAIHEVVPPEYEDLARVACESCPERAIVIDEDG